MKKVLSVILAILILTTAALSFFSCGTVTCALCHDEVSSVSAKKSEVMGQEVKICKDCYQKLKDLSDALS